MNWIDIILLLGVTGNVISAVKRGFGRELLHGLVYGALLGAGVLYIRLWPLPATAADTVSYLKYFGYYMVIGYIIAWVVMTFGARVVLGDGRPGMVSRLGAVVLTLSKIVVSLLLLNLYLAMHSPDAHPLRLRALPGFVQNSWIIQTSDAYTDIIYRYLASQGIVTYNKFTERPRTETERKRDALDEFLSNARRPQPL